jgi:electron transfer flavoprotein alpha subunit
MLSDQHRILVLIETEKGQPIPLSFELLKAGRDLANKSGEKLSACILGSELHDLCEELSCFADEVITLDNERFRDFEVNLWTSALTTLCEAAKPATIIMGHTYNSMELAPKLAFRTGGDLITDCVHLERDEKGDHLLCTKPVYGGNAVAVIQAERRPEMVTLRAKVWHPLQKGEGKGHIVSFDSKPEQFTTPTESLEMIPEESVNLDKADAIVSAGRGVKSAEGVQELDVLLKALRNHFHHVELGASRPLVDEGIMPRSRQIGQTGEKVGSRIYIALAISGAAQHVAGITACKKVVAINKDPDAPIFEGADYGVAASYQDVLPGFIKKLEELQ